MAVYQAVVECLGGTYGHTAAGADPKLWVESGRSLSPVMTLGLHPTQRLVHYRQHL